MTVDLGKFWDERIGRSRIQSHLLDREIPVRVGWLHTLGAICLALILVLVSTGILLTFNYSPDPSHAYSSIRYIEHEVPVGYLVRGLHHWSATFLIVAIVLHLLHTLFDLAFVRPREITWVAGVLMLFVVLVLGFTGYLLPWDEKAYWATVVGTNMVRDFPVIGESLLSLVRGGAEVGAATLARFYGAHLTLLPLALALLLGLHLYLVVFHGITGKTSGRPGSDTEREENEAHVRGVSLESTPRTVPFWPNVVAMDAVAALLIMALLFLLALQIGAPLGAPADPTDTSYLPRPEWYFLPLFQLLAIVPGWAEGVAAIGIPSAGALLVLTVPWWSRRLLRSVAGRRSLLGGASLGLVLVVLLGIAGAAPSSDQETIVAPAVSRGRLLFEMLGCRNCHSIRGLGGVVGPDLTLVGLEHGDTVWLRDQLRDPRSHGPLAPMPDFPLEGERMTDLVAFLVSLGNDLRYSTAAPRLFTDRCASCHQLAGEGTGVFGPDLGQIGRIRSVSYVHQYIEGPTSLNSDALMPADKILTHEQVEDVSRYIVATALQRNQADEEH